MSQEIRGMRTGGIPQLILAVFEQQGPMRPKQFANTFGLDRYIVATAMWRMMWKGKLKRTSHGNYELVRRNV